MINLDNVKALLNQRYPDLAPISEGVFRGVDRHEGREYAVRYFDLNDEVVKTAKSLKEYQEDLLSEGYFAPDKPTDLRWSHYLYFIANDEHVSDPEFRRSRVAVEGDREYARKQVVLESELPRLLNRRVSAQGAAELPPDLASVWTARLEAVGLGFILDEQIQVPEVVRRIAAGQKDTAASLLSPIALLPAEVAGGRCFLSRVEIHGFRAHPVEKVHSLGRANLIVGANGAGKTSLLEAIEYAYCGRNRRSSVVPNGTSVVVDLSGSGEKLASTTSTVRLRARHSHWYAKTELKTVTIEDSFGKFNFLDTDAAVNLSVSSSTQQVGTDVARLVLGAEAEKLGDRLRRVYERVDTDRIDLEKSLNSNDVLATGARERLNALESSPKVSDSLFSELLASLVQVGWIRQPASKAEVDSLRNDVLSAMSAVGLLGRAEADVLRSDSESLQRFWVELTRLAQEANELQTQLGSLNLQMAEQGRRLRDITDRVAGIDSLIVFARADFEAIHGKIATLQQSINGRSSQLSTIDLPLNRDHFVEGLAIQLGDALLLATSSVASLRQNLQQRRGALQALETTQSDLAVLRERLLASAREFMQKVSDPNHCPVCRSEFAEGELSLRMALEADDSSEQSAALSAQILGLEDGLRRAQAIERSLQSLAAFVGKRAVALTVAEALELLDLETSAMEAESAELAAVRRSIAALSANGLTSEALASALVLCGFDSLPAIASLLEMRTVVIAGLGEIQRESAETQEKLARLNEQRETLATGLSLNLDTGAVEIAAHAQSRLNDFEAAMGARQIIASLMSLGSSVTVDGLTAGLATSQDLLVRVVTARAQESANDSALAKESKTILDLSKSAEESRIKIGYLNEAHTLLGELKKQSSDGELAARILSENASEIARVFGSIHMPNEFDIGSKSGKLRIVRRQSGAEVELGEMSTGQRAAYALALFLAMNTRLQPGPPVVLFDDPVAHVDDINVLSFLDHLRALVTEGKRQIFFATADSKLAGLFRQKFRFLGNEQFREILLRRE
ncbi:MAG: double-strand break repair Rad50 ATPase [Ramlibacter sp.]|nr:double-strand break repair Rad50 ATPase [Ramlibacter sp.]